MRCRAPPTRQTQVIPPAICGVLFLGLAAAVAGETESSPPAMRVLGHGPVAVFESASGQGRASWEGIVHALAPCLTVVTYDRPGIGQSPPPSDLAAPVLATDVAQHLLSALRSHGLTAPYLLVGHSIGGLYVQAFARDHPDDVAGIVLVDASSPLEPPGIFVSTVPPKPGSIEAAEEKGVAPSVAQLLAGPPLPQVPLVVLAATDHGDTPEREAQWRDVQRRTAALTPTGEYRLVDSGHFIQNDGPAAVIDAVLSVATATGADISACRH